MIEVSFMSRAIVNGKGLVQNVAKTKDYVSHAGMYKRRVFLIEVATSATLAEDRS